MKDFINILVTLILTGFVIGVAFLQVNYGDAWFTAFFPLTLLLFLWGVKLSNDYKN